MSLESRIKIWPGAGTVTGFSTRNGDGGNTTLTAVHIDFHDSHPTLDIELDEYGNGQSVTLSIHGGLERGGLGMFFQELGKRLLKTEGQVDDSISIRYDDEEGISRSSPQKKGLAGEAALNQWFNAVGISYLYINQSPETFSKLFCTNLKRPDFLVLFESIGLVAVDAKNRQLHINEKTKEKEYSLPFEGELKRVITFERLFRIPVWYAYLSEDSGALGSTWYWISALKALDVGKIKKNGDSKKDFLAIDLSHFERIENNEDLGKLYTHRLSSLNKLKKA